MRKTLIFLILLSIYGCAWVDKPTKLTSNDYMVVAGGNYRSWSDIKKDCYEEAEEFCRSIGKGVETVNYATHGVRGWSPQEAELTFRCVTTN